MAEILAPAGDAATARAAILVGADAIYLGFTRFSARDSATNFDEGETADIIRFAHLSGAKVYVCLNTLVKDEEIDDFFKAAQTAYRLGADALLVQDIFLGKALKEACPGLELHLSTQAGCCNVWGAALAKEYGFSRVVLARETPLEEIKAIAAIIETEVFVQGALCACFSGQCYLSSFAGNQSGNRGRCKQPCRKRYSVDRKGFEELAYALSPSDLCLGERVRELVESGVHSLKIEGRMRRSEYVAAAVEYYRAVLDGKSAKEERSRLARAFNRGDYTRGLAFGEENFLSRNVQGHIGEEVGTVEFFRGKPFCRSAFRAQKGDGFKILRAGKEVGGARFLSAEKDGFFLATDCRVSTGDTVRVTTDTHSNEAVLACKRLRRIDLSVKIVAGEFPVITCGDFTFTGGACIEEAKNAPLTEEEIIVSFQKVDTLPFAPVVRAETHKAFLPKSALNALRRAFYEAFSDHLAPARKPIEIGVPRAELTLVQSDRIAAITAGGATDADIDIFKCETRLPEKAGERYLYLPPYFTSADEARLRPLIEACDGIYCDGYYGIILAREYHKPLFAGTGFNLCNALSVDGVRKAGAKYFALSKEISAAQQRALAAEGAFALAAGDIKVMDLIFCPFSRSCASCDKRGQYTLTDEEGRRFPLRRYMKTGACRFELYNCFPLSGYNGRTGALVDISVSGDNALVAHARESETYLKNATGGHKNRSMQ